MRFEKRFHEVQKALRRGSRRGWMRFQKRFIEVPEEVL
jgi:hypothetical protein